MIVSNTFYFLKNANSATESPVTVSIQGETLTLQVDGDATNFSFQVLGCSDMGSKDFYVLNGFKTNFDLIDTVSEKGIYTFGIEGISKIKVNLASITGGSLSVFGRITEEA